MATATEAAPAPAAEVVPVHQEKSVPAAEPPLTSAPDMETKPLAPKADDNKALVVSEKAAEQKSSKGSLDRDIALAKLDQEKKVSYIKAWEENEKSKVENKAQKKLSEVAAWENSKKASLEAKLRKTEEQLEKKKAEYAEKMKNKAAMVHKQAEEKKAMVEARRGEDKLKAEELAAKYRATGHVPKKVFACLGC